MTNKEIKFQEKQLKKLRSSDVYQGASIYTILYDLIEGNGVEEVFTMLHNVSSDMNKREQLETLFKGAKKWKWIC